MTAGAAVRVALVGATGRTGNAVAHGLLAEAGVELVACIAPSVAVEPTRPLPAGVAAFARLEDADVEWDVLVDLSTGEAAPHNLDVALGLRRSCVLGATGTPDDVLESLGQRFAAAGLGLLYAPNFALGAVLMMRFAAEAARWLPHAQVVELHHEAKRDAPSGTARRTAQLVAAARDDGASGQARGGSALGELVDGVPVHSLRLPGAVAHQEVVFGAVGQLLTIRHDAIGRECYASGVALAARRVASCVGLTIGLENVL